MSESLANNFNEILSALSRNDELRAAILQLIETESVAGKATEGGNRLANFRQILQQLVNNELDLQMAFTRVHNDLSRNTSLHASSNRVFAEGWEERLVRTQLSRFYNQALMEKLLAEGETECFVPHSSSEDSNSPCSSQLAGRNQDLNILYSRLISSYGQGNFSKDLKIPNHPHCTHVITRIK